MLTWSLPRELIDVVAAALTAVHPRAQSRVIFRQAATMAAPYAETLSRDAANSLLRGAEPTRRSAKYKELSQTRKGFARADKA